MEKVDYTPPQSDYIELIREKTKRQFFMKLMDMDLTVIEPGWVEAELEIQEKHFQQNYFVHGGVMSTASDIVMGFAAYTLCREHKGVVTANLEVNYLNPGIGQKLIAKGRVRKAGSKLFFCEAEIYVVNNGKPTLTNTASSIMTIIDLVPIAH